MTDTLLTAEMLDEHPQRELILAAYNKVLQMNQKNIKTRSDTSDALELRGLYQTIYRRAGNRGDRRYFMLLKDWMTFERWARTQFGHVWEKRDETIAWWPRKKPS